MLLKRLKQERAKVNLSQLALSKIIGVSQQTVGSWEIGRTTPDPEMISKLANVFGCTTDYLLGRTNNPYNKGLLMENSTLYDIKTSSQRQKPEELEKILTEREILFKGELISEEAKKNILETMEFHYWKQKK